MGVIDAAGGAEEVAERVEDVSLGDLAVGVGEGAGATVVDARIILAE
jgi:hypothetical protein